MGVVKNRSGNVKKDINGVQLLGLEVSTNQNVRIAWVIV
jgi:hypothetical protein